MQERTPALCCSRGSTIGVFPALRRVFLFVVIAICSSAVVRAEYYPIRVGYEAVFRGSYLGYPMTVTTSVPERVLVAGVPCMVELQEVRSQSISLFSSAALAHIDGDLLLYRYCPISGPCYTHSTPSLELPAAPYAQQSWRMYYSQYGYLDRTVIATNVAVTVPYGHFQNCVLIQETQPYEDNPAYEWLADGYGIVKVQLPVEGTIVTCELVDLTLPAPPLPAVTITSPTAGQTVTAGPSVKLSGTAFCDSTLTSVKWSSDRGGSGTCSGTNYWEVQAAPLQSGANRFTIAARSVYGKEASASVTVNYAPNTAPMNVSVTPDSGTVQTGTKTTFTTVHSDAAGYGTISTATLFLSETDPPEYGAYPRYLPASNKLYLYDFDSKTWKGGYAPGSAQVIENSYCRLYCAETAVQHSGETLTINWRIELKQTLSGKTLREWMYTEDSGGLNTGWVQKGEIVTRLPNRPPVNVSVAPESGSLAIGAPLIFTSQYTDPEGTGDIKGAYLLLNTTLTGANGVYLWLDARANKLWLGDDAGKAWLGGYEPGSANVIENKTCRLYCSDTTVVSENNTLKVNWRVELKPSAGGKTLKEWMYVLDMSGLSDGWESLGSLQVQSTDKPPVNTGVTPSSGTVSTGAATTFTSQHSDPNGSSTLKGAYLLLNETLSGANAVYLWYDCTANKLYLRDSANRAWLGPITPGAAYTLENSACKLYGSDTTVAFNSSTLTLNWRVELKPSAGGRDLKEWMYVVDKSGLSDGWASHGTISVATPDISPVNTSLTPSSGTVSTGQAMTYTSLHSDPNGASTLKGAYLLLNETLSGTNAVYLWFDCTANKIYLRDSANKTWLGPVSPGAASTLENSACKLYCSDTTVVTNNQTLMVNWRVELKPSAAGRSLKAWMYTIDATEIADGWEQMGALSVASYQQPPLNLGTTPSGGALALASPFTLTSRHSDPDGATTLKGAYLLLDETLDGANAVYLWYDCTANRIYLRDSANKAWSAGVAPGAGVALENNTCRVYCAETSVVREGEALSVNWRIELKSSAMGRNLKAWMYTVDSTGRADGWEQVSAFSIALSGLNVSVSPINTTIATGSAVVLTAHCLAPSGKTATNTYLLLNSAIDSRGGVYLQYDGPNNKMYLRNDAGTAWVGGYAPGSANTISNTLVTVNCASSLATMAGDQLEVRWSVQLTPAAVGRVFNVWMYTVDSFGRTDGWDQMGFLWILEQPPDPVFRFALQL